jgi:hypothetical protein
MFTMDIPYEPMQDAPIVLAQAAVSGAESNTQQLGYLLKTCKELPKGAEDWTNPAAGLAVYLENHSNRNIYGDPSALASIKITLLDAPKHGTFKSDSTGQGYFYAPEPGYLGNDKAVFMAEFEGKYYKIVANLIVAVHTNENVPLCPESTLIKLNPKPASGSLGIDLGAITVTMTSINNVAGAGAVARDRSGNIPVNP